MDQPNTDAIQGTLDMLILKTLAHGFGITRRIAQMSRGVFKVTPGSLFPALQRLGPAAGPGCLSGQDGCMREWRRTGNLRRSSAIARPLKAEA